MVSSRLTEFVSPLLARGNRDVPLTGSHLDKGSGTLRLQLFSLEQLERHARALATEHKADVKRGPDRLLPRLAENERVLIHAYDLVTEAVAEGRRVALASEWLLDNFYVVEQQIRMARLHLPRGYSRQLPRLLNGPCE